MATHRQRPQDQPASQRGRHRPWPIPLLLALALVLGACTTESADAPDQPTGDAEAVDGPAADDTAPDDVEANESPEDTSDEQPPEDEQAATSGDGNGTITVGGESHELRVIHCFFDAVSPLVGEEVPFILDGVPPAAPDDVVDPLRGLLSTEELEELDTERIRELTQPVLAHGPVLGVARVEDDGASDVMSLQFADGTVYQTDFGGFLEISGDGPGATVTGTAEATALNIDDPDAEVADPGPLSLEATCP